MAENIIYCYSGTGNCLDIAMNIAKELGDTDIVMMRSFPSKTDATEYKRVGFVFPCYGGGLPGMVEDYLKSIHIGIDRMEALGIYEVAPEDFALCEFVDASKTPVQQVIADGLVKLRKEME